MNAHELRALLREEVLGYIPDPGVNPPPHDREAEEIVASTVLCGNASPAGLDVEAEDFFLPLPRLVFGAAAALEERGHPVDAYAIAEALAVHDVRGPVPELLLELRDLVPLALGRNLRLYAEQVRQCAQVRRLLESLASVSHALRCNSISADDAKARLREVAQ
ncbi:MAG: hypothetical protein IPI67_18060 [Myxococcales bacterium]|nr:hypothetical protein [Myxococcales bacterium]